MHQKICLLNFYFILLIVIFNVEVWSKSTLMDNKQCQCGIREYRDRLIRVINGKHVSNTKEYPWFVTVYSLEDVRDKWGDCAGAIISLRHILTATHCLISKRAPLSCLISIEENCYLLPNDIEIGLLSSATTEPGIKVKVKYIFPHPEYNPKSHENDIAIIKLRNNIKCSPFSRPICLSSVDIAENSEEIKIAGVGRINTDEYEKSEYLRDGIMTVTTSTDCTLKKAIDPEKILCASGVGQSSCEGDSGSPAIMKYSDRYFAVGVASMHTKMPSCNPDYPAIFTKISAYYGFIKKHVKHLPPY